MSRDYIVAITLDKFLWSCDYIGIVDRTTHTYILSVDLSTVSFGWEWLCLYSPGFSAGFCFMCFFYEWRCRLDSSMVHTIHPSSAHHLVIAGTISIGQQWFLCSVLLHDIGCWLTSSVWGKSYHDSFLVCLFDVYSKWLCLRSNVLSNCTSSLLANNRVRPLVDCLCKDSCEVVSADESHPIVVCFCLQKRRCKKLHVSSVCQNSPRVLMLSSLEVVFKWLWHLCYVISFRIKYCSWVIFSWRQKCCWNSKTYMECRGEQIQFGSAG